MRCAARDSDRVQMLGRHVRECLVDVDALDLKVASVRGMCHEVDRWRAADCPIEDLRYDMVCGQQLTIDSPRGVEVRDRVVAVGQSRPSSHSAAHLHRGRRPPVNWRLDSARYPELVYGNWVLAAGRRISAQLSQTDIASEPHRSIPAPINSARDAQRSET